MKCNDQNRSCHAERVSRSPEPFASLKGKLREGEASFGPSRQTLRCAQGDKSFPILLVKFHYRPVRRPGPCTNAVPEAYDSTEWATFCPCAPRAVPRLPARSPAALIAGCAPLEPVVESA